MLKVIRNSTFETNSSSMHSLVISKRPRNYDFWDITFETGEKTLSSFELYRGEFISSECEEYSFGRTPFRILATPIEKLRFWVVYYAVAFKDNAKITEAIEFIHNRFKVPYNAIKLTATVIEYYGEGEYEDAPKTETYGNIEIEKPILKELEDNKVSIEEFLLSPKYSILIDGDEYRVTNKFFDAGYISEDDIEYITRGINYYLPKEQEIPFNWLMRLDDKDTNLEFLLEMENDIDSRIQKLQITFDYVENIKLSRKIVKKIKEFLNLYKEKFPNREIVFYPTENTTWIIPKFIDCIDRVVPKGED